MLQALVAVVRAAGGPRLPFRASESEGGDAIPELVFANGLLETLTGWVPAVALEDGLGRAWTEMRAPLRQEG
jgi:hypothetical protein